MNTNIVIVKVVTYHMKTSDVLKQHLKQLLPKVQVHLYIYMNGRVGKKRIWFRKRHQITENIHGQITNIKELEHQTLRLIIQTKVHFLTVLKDKLTYQRGQAKRNTCDLT